MLQDATVLLVMGLPGSGKTELARTLSDFVLVDDFVRSFFWDDAVPDLLRRGRRVALADPRLCMADVFGRVIARIARLVPQDRVHVLAFDNDPDACLVNLAARGEARDAQIRGIVRPYAAEYERTLPLIDGWRHTRLPVFVPL